MNLIPASYIKVLDIPKRQTITALHNNDRNRAGFIKYFFSKTGEATAAPSVSPAYTMDPSVPNSPLFKSKALDIYATQPGKVPWSTLIRILLKKIKRNKQYISL